MACTIVDSWRPLLQAAKICNNMLLAITMIGTSEALQLAKRLATPTH